MRKFMNSREAAEMLGFSVSKLYKLTMTRQIPHKKVFGRLRFNREQLEAWYEKNLVDVTEMNDIERKADEIMGKY